MERNCSLSSTQRIVFLTFIISEPRRPEEIPARKICSKFGAVGMTVKQNRKGCDIGYALAANSCEGVNSVEACTVTALDAITAFAVPNPGGTSQSSRFFQVWSFHESPRRTDHSAYFRPATY